MTDEEWMQRALAEADLAAADGEVPVGCVVVDAAGAELARGRNAREKLSDPTAHAEMIAIREAAARVGSWRLEGVTVYVTLEPCPMCAGALVNARVRRVVYAASDAKAGAAGSVMDLCRDARLNHRLEVCPGVRADEAADLLRSFFRARR